MYNDSQEFNIPLQPSRSGYTGRECPECGKYFKIVFGTGLTEIEHCYCPYCGFHAHHSHFHTESQIDYATSKLLNSLMSEFDSSLRQMARQINRSSRQSQGLLKLTMDVKSTPSPILYPTDLKLESYIECSNCTLEYAVYGVYAYCPDCARHNAVQILDNILEISGKLLELSSSNDAVLVDRLLSRSLTDVVSSFDGFGREICRAFASKSSNSAQAEKISFQNLLGAQRNIQKYFGFDMATALTAQELEMAIRCFQKRHVLEHKSGVVDEEYISKANDPKARVGRKVTLTADEVRQLITVVHRLGKHIFAEMEK